MSNNIKLTVRQLPVSLFFALTVFLFIPLNFFIANYSELSVDYSVLIRKVITTAAVALLVSLAASVASFFINEKLNKGVQSLLFIAGVFVFFEYLFIMPQVGLLNGEPFNVKNHIGAAVADIVFLLVSIITAVVFFKKEAFLPFLRKASLLLVVMQTIVFATTPSVYNFEANQEQNGIYSFKYYGFDLAEYNVYSKNENIAVVLMDGFGQGVFEELLKKYPEYAEIFKDFEFYKNAVSSRGSQGTSAAIPALFTSINLDGSIQHNEQYYATLKKIYSADTALLPVLKKNGWTNYIYPWLSNIMYLSPSVMDNLVLKPRNSQGKSNKLYRKLIKKVVAFHAFPVIRKKSPHKFLTHITLAKTQKFLPFAKPFYVEDDFYNKFRDKISTDNEKKVFKYYHLHGLHEPYMLNERFEVENISEGKDDPVELTAKLYMTMLKNYLNSLKKAGIYDKTAVIFMSDHGMNRLLSPLQRGRENVANPLLMYKNFNQEQKEMKIIEDIYPDVSDVSDLIFYSAGITDKKLDIPEEENNKKILEEFRLNKLNEIKTAYLKKSRFDKKNITAAKPLKVRIYYYTLNGKNGMLTVSGEGNAPDGINKKPVKTYFILTNKKGTYLVTRDVPFLVLDSGVYFFGFNFIAKDVPTGKYDLKFLVEDNGTFYSLETGIKEVAIDKKIKFVFDDKTPGK
ncbi:MAG: sulfatase-like hydrolase/transferase [Alphaproteobacteria bacterium]|nr:sulfatase-like hydrolase/transferase [Alphaproteobacteria bacterium]